MIKQFIMHVSEEAVTLLAAVTAALIARWLYGLSSPKKDLAWLLSLAPFQFSLRWYRGIELYHQIRGMRILYEYRTSNR